MTDIFLSCILSSVWAEFWSNWCRHYILNFLFFRNMESVCLQVFFDVLCFRTQWLNTPTPKFILLDLVPHNSNEFHWHYAEIMRFIFIKGKGQFWNVLLKSFLLVQLYIYICISVKFITPIQVHLKILLAITSLKV